MKLKTKQIGLALLLTLATATLVMAAPDKESVEPKALFDSKMYLVKGGLTHGTIDI